RTYTNTCPFELVATPTASPKYVPAGSLKKFGTESNGISGVVAFALAAAPPPCAKAGALPASSANARMRLRRRIMASCKAAEHSIDMNGGRVSQRTTFARFARFATFSRFDGFAEVLR